MARLPPLERSPASVAKYVLSWFWKTSRSELARGSAVAKVWRAKLSGERLDAAKLMEENDIPPDVTSGTPPMVVTAVLQVMTGSTASAEV
jgi:hypothetical protein